jgi:uncharacterized membrane protein YeiB
LKVEAILLTIFSILFGFGFYMQIRRAEEKRIAFRYYFIKRMIILLVIGCVHGVIGTYFYANMASICDSYRHVIAKFIL